MRILPAGVIKTDSSNKDAGFVLLRSLLVMSSVILCAFVFLAAVAIFVKQSALLIPEVQNELEYRNNRTLENLQ